MNGLSLGVSYFSGHPGRGKSDEGGQCVGRGQVCANMRTDDEGIAMRWNHEVEKGDVQLNTSYLSRMKF